MLKNFQNRWANIISFTCTNWPTIILYIHVSRYFNTNGRSNNEEKHWLRIELDSHVFVKIFVDTIWFRFSFMQLKFYFILLHKNFIFFFFFIKNICHIIRHDRFFKFCAWKIGSPCCCVLVLISIEQINSYTLSIDQWRIILIIFHDLWLTAVACWYS